MCWFCLKMNVIFGCKCVTSVRSDSITRVCCCVDATHLKNIIVVLLFRLMLEMLQCYFIAKKSREHGGKNQNNLKRFLRKPYRNTHRAQHILLYFFTLPFLCSWNYFHLWIFLSLCKQITRIRENTISIFLCLYLHYGACVGALMKLKDKWRVLHNYYYLFF